MARIHDTGPGHLPGLPICEVRRAERLFGWRALPKAIMTSFPSFDDSDIGLDQGLALAPVALKQCGTNVTPIIYYARGEMLSKF